MEPHVDMQRLSAALLALPEMAAWPEVAGLFPGAAGEIRMDWRLPALACRALGSPEELALQAMAAMACLQISIILVDDILDQDPDGEYHRLGPGRAANLALAFQAASVALLDQAPIPAENKAAAAYALSRAALTTAYGQDLDVQNLRGEENYWRVVRTKSTPFYGVGLQVGALVAGARPEVAQGLYEVGALVGEITQVFDDLVDAFESPANPDWGEGRNNLAILFAVSTDHPQRQKFLELRGQASDPEKLKAAQQILISCGAVSYCVYLLIQRYRAALTVVERLALPDPAVVADLLNTQMVPLRSWLQSLGLPVPVELKEPQA